MLRVAALVANNLCIFGCNPMAIFASCEKDLETANHSTQQICIALCAVSFAEVPLGDRV